MPICMCMSACVLVRTSTHADMRYQVTFTVLDRTCSARNLLSTQFDKKMALRLVLVQKCSQ